MALPSVDELQQQFHAALESATTAADPQGAARRYLSRKHGRVTLLLKSIAKHRPMNGARWAPRPTR